MLLLVSAIGYWILGNVLEYVRNVEKIIIIPIIAAFGLLKIIVRIFKLTFKQVGLYDIWIERDLEVLVANRL